jgi:small-conductance mechanosensitive channel
MKVLFVLEFPANCYILLFGFLAKGASKMKHNMGTFDRIIRILIAIAIGVLYFTNQISGVAAIILGIIAVAFVLTGFGGLCPGYLPFDLSTKKKTNATPSA